MFTFHQLWFYVAVISAGVVGLWGLVLAIRKTVPSPPFLYARNAAIGAMLVQVGAGLALWGDGRRPADAFHVFYGVLITVTFSFAYIYRIQMERRPALSYGLLLLFVMGLGLRAWSNVG